MAFDLQAAQESGATDAQIADHLSRKHAFKLAEARQAGAADAQIIGHLMDKEAPPAGRTWGEFGSDMAASAGQGANTMVSSLAWLADRAGQGFGLDVDLGVQDAMQRGAEYWHRQKSPHALANEERLAEAEGITGTLQALVNNPEMTADLIATSAPYMVPGGVVAKAGAGPKGVLATNALLEGADAGAEAERQVSEIAPGKAWDAGNKAFLTSAAISAIASKLTKAADLEDALFTGKELAGNFLNTTGREVVEEAVQEGGNQLGQNVGVRTVDKTRGYFDDVGKAATLGSVLGTAQGGGMNALDTAGKALGQVKTADESFGLVEELNHALSTADASLSEAEELPSPLPLDEEDSGAMQGFGPGDAERSSDTEASMTTVPHSDVAKVEAELRQRLGDNTLDKLITDGKLKLVATPEDLPGGGGKASDAKGYYDGETAYLVANNLDNTAVMGVFLHELGEHAGMRDMLGGKYQLLVNQFQSLLKSGDEWAAKVEAQVQGLLDRGALRPQDADSERLAYLIQVSTDAGAKSAGVNKLSAITHSAVAAIKAWLFAKTPLAKTLNLKPADFAALARRSVQYVTGREESAGAKLNEQYAQGNEDEQTVRAADRSDEVGADPDETFNSAAEQAGEAKAAESHGKSDELVNGQEVTPPHQSHTPSDDSPLGSDNNTPSAVPVHPESFDDAAVSADSIQNVADDVGLYSQGDIDADNDLAKALADGDRRSVREWLSDAKSKHFRKVLAAIPRRYLPDFAEEGMTAVQEYIRIAQRMDADRNQLISDGAEIVDKWVKWSGKKKNKRAAKALAELMHSSTIAGVDPSKPYKEIVTPAEAKQKIAVINEKARGRSGDGTGQFEREKKAVRDQLKQEAKRKAASTAISAAWERLPAEAKTLYVDVRDAYTKQRIEVYKALEARIRRAQLGDTQRRGLMEQLRDQFESNTVEEPYFPLARFGEYTAAAREQSGERVDEETGEVVPNYVLVEFTLHETKSARDKWDKAQKAKGYEVEVGRQSEAKKAVEAIDPAFASKVTSMVGQLGGQTAQDLQDDIWQLYLRTLPEMSGRKQFVHRKKVPGFNGDAIRAFSKQMFHGGSQLGRLRYSDVLAEKLDEMHDQALAAEREDLMIPLYDEMVARHDWAMNPKSGWLANRATSLGFAWYLGATPAAALVNLTQTPILGVPILGARHGTAKAVKELSKAMTMATRWGGIEGTLKGDELLAYNEFLRIGLFDKTQAHDLAGISETGEEYSPTFHKAMEMVGWMFHRAEVWNREATAMAAYRLGRKSGMSLAAAVQHAEDMTWDIHFDYANVNRPRIMQNDFSKVFLLFKQYSLNISYRLLRDAYTAMPGVAPEISREARYRLTGVLGMTFILGGASSMPLFWAFELMANAIAAAATPDDEDKPIDVIAATRASLADAYGPEAAQLLMKGALDTYAGATLSSRISLNNLWLRDPDFREEGEDIGKHYIMEMVGPVPKIFMGMAEGAHRISEGHGLRGLEPAVPKIVRDSLKSYRYLTEGATNMRGDPILEETTPYQAALQWIGFSPSELSMQYDQNNILKRAENKISDRRANLVNAYALAFKNNDPEAERQALVAMERFNRNQPDWIIDGKTLADSVKGRYRVSEQMKDGMMLNRRLDEQLRREFEFVK